jgi:hypothetical protein
VTLRAPRRLEPTVGPTTVRNRRIAAVIGLVKRW